MVHIFLRLCPSQTISFPKLIFLRPYLSQALSFSVHIFLRPHLSQTISFPGLILLSLYISQATSFSDHIFPRPYLSHTISFSHHIFLRPSFSDHISLRPNIYTALSLSVFIFLSANRTPKNFTPIIFLNLSLIFMTHQYFYLPFFKPFLCTPFIIFPFFLMLCLFRCFSLSSPFFLSFFLSHCLRDFFFLFNLFPFTTSPHEHIVLILAFFNLTI